MPCAECRTIANVVVDATSRAVIRLHPHRFVGAEWNDSKGKNIRHGGGVSTLAQKADGANATLTQEYQWEFWA
jgi:hypothetical protein